MRVTDAKLEQIVRIINSNLPEKLHISLRFAYGSTGVSGNGDSKDLSGLGTKAEALLFLHGIQEGMSLARQVQEMETAYLIEKAKAEVDTALLEMKGRKDCVG